MATVTLRLAPRRAHVRTARLVASAMARRSGVAEDLLDDVRLAVGEACARAVRLHERNAVDVPVTLELTDDDTFTVVVADSSLRGTSAGTSAEERVASLVGAGAETPGTPQPGFGRGAKPVSAPMSASAIAAWTSLAEECDERDPRDNRWAESELLGLAVLEGVVDDLTVERGGEGTRVRMSWPVRTDG